MAKIKLTKNEMKKQKDALKRFQRYLPTLMLKKQQLQKEIRNVEIKIEDVKKRIHDMENDISSWIAVYGEDIDLSKYVIVENIETEEGNIAGVDIPIFNTVTYKKVDYDLFTTPPWLDRGIEMLKKRISYTMEIRVLEKQAELLGEELRITSQRVNLFEKVMIPQTQSNIKKIAIFLGDQQTAAVVRGKISKKKLKR